MVAAIPTTITTAVAAGMRCRRFWRWLWPLESDCGSEIVIALPPVISHRYERTRGSGLRFSLECSNFGKSPYCATSSFLAGAMKRSGVQSVTIHDLRHTCASLAVSANVNVLALARMLGHKGPSAAGLRGPMAKVFSAWVQPDVRGGGAASTAPGRVRMGSG